MESKTTFGPFVLDRERRQLMREGQAHAFFVVDGRLEERILSLGPSQGDRVSVVKGAALNEAVALGPFEQLANGQRVR